MVEIRRADFADPGLTEFLQAHLADMAPTAPAESQHALQVDELDDDGVRLWVATDGNKIVGTVALSELDAGHDELKSMHTDPASRGGGIAAELLVHALEDARARGVGRVSLETGSMAFFEPARRFYLKHGFVTTTPFGPYTDDPNSVFMTRSLSDLGC